jgi:hypothetical protein
MRTPRRPNNFPSAASVLAWLLDLATRLLARILNMPEPLVHNTGVFVFAHVQAVETSIGNRLPRQLRCWRRSASRLIARPPSSGSETGLPRRPTREAGAGYLARID